MAAAEGPRPARWPLVAIGVALMCVALYAVPLAILLFSASLAWLYARTRSQAGVPLAGPDTGGEVEASPR